MRVTITFGTVISALLVLASYGPPPAISVFPSGTGGTHKLSINGQVVHVQQDTKHPRAAVSFWLADDGGSYRFSNISVTPL